MAEKKPSKKSPTRSSADPSKAGSRPAATSRPGTSAPASPAAERGAGRRSAEGGILDEARLLTQLEAGRFPASLYLEGPDEALKAAVLSEIRFAWARSCPEAPHARVLRAAEAGVEEILASFHGASLFTPRELIVVLDLEGLGRSSVQVKALAEGLARPSGGSCLVLVESAAESPRKALELLRMASEARCVCVPLGRSALVAWGQRRVAREGLEAEPGLIETLADACDLNPAETFNELDKLIACVGKDGKITRALASALLRPVAGAELRDYLAAVALGDPSQAARRLGQLLAAGAGEGTVFFALANLVGGSLGGWARHRDLSIQLARRRPPADLARALDALYRGEAAWKRGRADVVAVLEQATRVVSARN
jgi:DNA polymerase III delta subunit